MANPTEGPCKHLYAPFNNEDQADNIVMQTEEKKESVVVFSNICSDEHPINELVKINRCIHDKKFIIYSLYLT